MSNINYNTLGDLQMDLLRLVRISAWIALYWMEVSDIRMDGIRFFQGRG
jgi:hypothetical protein